MRTICTMYLLKSIMFSSTLRVLGIQRPIKTEWDRAERYQKGIQISDLDFAQSFILYEHLYLESMLAGKAHGDDSLNNVPPGRNLRFGVIPVLQHPSLK
jgi:hypothetical protein